MAVPATSGQSQDVNHSIEAADEWLTEVLNKIPRSIYGEKTKSKSNETQSLTKKQAQKSRAAIPKKGPRSMPVNVEGNVSELQKRLRQKILERRQERKADDAERQARRANKKRRKEDKKSGSKLEKKPPKKAQKRKEKPSSKEDGELKAAKENHGKEKVAQTEIEVSRVQGFSEDGSAGEGAHRPKKRPRTKSSKLNELQKQLESAIVDKEQLKEAQREKEGTSEISSIAAEREIEKALRKAKGIAVKDDVTKLRKSIRKEKRKKEKSRETWEKLTKSSGGRKISQSAKERRESERVSRK